MTNKQRFSFALYFIVFYILWILRATVFYSAVDLSITDETTRLIFANGVKIVLWVVPAVAYLIWMDQKNPLDVMRIRTAVDGNGVKIATIIALLYFVVVFAVEYWINGRSLSPLLHSGFRAIVGALVSVFISPFAEEFAFRGFVLPKLQETQPFWSANLIQSILFTAMHLPSWIWLNGLGAGLVVTSVTVFILGLFLGWFTVRTNSIWFPIAVHILNNFLVSFLG